MLLLRTDLNAANSPCAFIGTKKKREEHLVIYYIKKYIYKYLLLQIYFSSTDSKLIKLKSLCTRQPEPRAPIYEMIQEKWVKIPTDYCYQYISFSYNTLCLNKNKSD